MFKYPLCGGLPLVCVLGRVCSALPFGCFAFRPLLGFSLPLSLLGWVWLSVCVCVCVCVAFGVLFVSCLAFRVSRFPGSNHSCAAAFTQLASNQYVVFEAYARLNLEASSADSHVSARLRHGASTVNNPDRRSLPHLGSAFADRTCLPAARADSICWAHILYQTEMYSQVFRGPTRVNKPKLWAQTFEFVPNAQGAVCGL